MGIRNMELYNLSLFGKWRWRLLDDKDSVWCDLIRRLYGNGGLLNGGQCYVWWKDLNALDEWIPQVNGWFRDSVRPKLGDGREVRFWVDKWCDQCCLVGEHAAPPSTSL